MKIIEILTFASVTGLGLLATATCGVAPARAQTAKDLVGTWQLVSSTSQIGGKTTDTFGENPDGLLVLTSDGHFINMLSRNNLTRVASNNRMKATPAEDKAIVQGSIAFFGRYSASKRQLLFEIDASTFPNWKGVEQKQDIKAFKGNEMTEELNGSNGLRVQSTWRRIK